MANSEEWEIHDNLIMSWLLNSMQPEISELFIHGTETSAKMWIAHQQDVREIKQLCSHLPN
jgi:hypothetical protein